MANIRNVPTRKRIGKRMPTVTAFVGTLYQKILDNTKRKENEKYSAEKGETYSHSRNFEESIFN